MIGNRLKEYNPPNLVTFGYAGYRPEIIEFLCEEVLKRSKSILEPMAGFAPLIPYIEHFGIYGRFIELLPHHYYLNKAKTADVYYEVKGALENGGKISQKNLLALLKDIRKYKLLVSDEWIPKEILAGLTRAWRRTNQYNELERAFYKAAIITTVRHLSTYSISSQNNTWLKPGGITKDLSLSNITSNVLKGFIKYYRYCYDETKKNRKSKIEISCGDIKDFRTRRKFDAIVASPPFPNRFDYLRYFGPELYFLSKVDSDCATSGLKTKIIGTNIVRDYFDIDKAERELTNNSTQIKSFLDEVDRKEPKFKKRKGENKYYLRYFVRYYSNLFNATNSLLDFLAKEGSIYYALQNNVHRGELNDMASFVVDYYTTKGYDATVVWSKSRAHQGRRNISAIHPLVLKRQVESIVRIKK